MTHSQQLKRLDLRRVGSIDPHTQLLLVGKDSGGAAVLIDAILCADGYCLIGVADVDAASVAIALCPPSLIVLNLALGEDNGHAWMRLLKADPATVQIPILVVSPSMSFSGCLDALKAGADVFLMQPLEPDELRLRVRNLLRLTGTSRPKYVETVALEDKSARELSAVGADQLSDRALQVTILDALPATVALLDRQGVLVSVNQAWRNFADVNGMAAACNFGIGSNYLAICELACLSPENGSEEVARGI